MTTDEAIKFLKARRSDMPRYTWHQPADTLIAAYDQVKTDRDQYKNDLKHARHLLRRSKGPPDPPRPDKRIDVA